ncbi:very short patch repair endonuclease [Luteibacter sp.]|uniref:very short patch repair endonuclease n=1 Tax=Luteibacter sp. TaxID=1886636 RepID=UPI00280973CC|nr:very short patch repair endonuclease [Luteibacter sp.]MDQ8049495.1 very short patch repair endonuclease [Luteibacter sp.]
MRKADDSENPLLSPGQAGGSTRSALMRRVKQKHTGPEILLRKILHRLGFRFSLHVAALPGTPDIVMRKHRSVIFVNGCFWHGHDCRRGALPATRREFWERKIVVNRARDARVERQLLDDGWRVLTVWECAITGKSRLPRAELETLLTTWLRHGAESASDALAGRKT